MVDKDEKKLGISFIDSLAVRQVHVANDFEIEVVENMIKEGVLQELPVINTILDISKTISITKEYFLIRNVMIFLNGLIEVSQKEKDEFVKKINEDAIFSNRVGEKLLFILNKCDCIEKPKLFSKIFTEYIKQKISYQDLNHIVSGIEKAFIEDLDEILQVFSLRKDVVSNNLIWERVFYSGFSKQKVINFKVGEYLKKLVTNPYSVYKDNLIEYEANEYGIKFAKIILGDKYRNT